MRSQNPNNEPRTQKVAILTSGGLAPCLSSAVGYLIEFYTQKSPETQIICYLNGYRGLLLGDSIKVTEKIRKQAPKLQHLGGSPIGNSRIRLKNAIDCVKKGLVRNGESPEKIAAEQLIKDEITVYN
ncbi:hypothetical protein MHBO_001563 [Bonamia ostreae]|uniref:Phosphofructokinase domain-containing protein n=1 Tax=Bonamia ostreae TaxID=126728 RepID=A0ABV2AK05_9EUKA